jgi:hypothetical protein
MKVLVSTKKTQGQRSNDFNHNAEGGLIGWVSECDCRGGADSSCGCKRCWQDIENGGMTTTAEIVERDDITPEKWEQMIYDRYVAGGWVKDNEAEARCWAKADVREFVRLAQIFQLDDVLEKRGNKIQTREKATALK